MPFDNLERNEFENSGPGFFPETESWGLKETKIQISRNLNSKDPTSDKSSKIAGVTAGPGVNGSIAILEKEGKTKPPLGNVEKISEPGSTYSKEGFPNPYSNMVLDKILSGYRISLPEVIPPQALAHSLNLLSADDLAIVGEHINRNVAVSLFSKTHSAEFISDIVNVSSNDQIKLIAEHLKAQALEIFKRQPMLSGSLAVQARSYGVALSDEFGREKPKLRVEVEILVARAKKGEQVAPDYKSGKVDGKWDTPLEYLKVVWGKYLAYFNEDRDYMYQFDLSVIDSQLIRNVTKYITNHRDGVKSEIAYYIPTKNAFLREKFSGIPPKTLSSGARFVARL